MKPHIGCSICKAIFAVMLILAPGTFSYASDGQISMAPVNPELLDFLQSSAQEQISKNDGSEKKQRYYIVPSPLTPVVHKPSLQIKGTLADTVYDMRDPDNDPKTDDAFLTPVKNQGSRNTCWAFATFGSLESQIKQHLNEEEDFSEDNLVYHHGFDRGPDAGGNIDMSAAYLSRFAGPVSEADDPYDDQSEDTGLSPLRYIDNVVFLPVRSGAGDIDYIKQAVMDHGGIYSNIYWNQGYYNSDGNTYYYTGSSTYSNHAIVIVGWDDTKTVAGAPGNGAFIVRNSWGQNWGDNGYFYVSYHDPLLGYKTLACFDDKEDDSSKINKVYYYDELGTTGTMGYGTPEAYGANWFVPEKNGTLYAVNFYAVSGMSYEITVYDNHSGSSFSGILAAQTGELPYGGWHTIKLDTPVSYQANDGFGIAVKFESNDTKTLYPVPLERPIADYSSRAVSNEGESYYSRNGKSWTDAHSNGFGNVCIKALCWEPPYGDMDEDDDVDGKDLYHFAQSFAGEEADQADLHKFADNFGSVF